MLLTLSGAGLRRSELSQLKVGHIHSQRMVLSKNRWTASCATPSWDLRRRVADGSSSACLVSAATCVHLIKRIEP
jgi:hypothetical protein